MKARSSAFRRPTVQLLVVAATVLVASGPSAAADPAVFAVELEPSAETANPADPPFEVVHAVYEVEVWGGTALGTLKQEFVNRLDEDRSFHYRVTTDGRMEIGELELVDAAGTEPLAAQRIERPQQKVRQDAPDRRRALAGYVSPLPGDTFRSDAFGVAAGESVSLRTSFRLPVALDGRMFRLTLPAIHEPMGRTESGGPAAPLRIVVTVHHDRKLLAVDSPTHRILADFVGDRTIVETVVPEVSTDRDFELVFALNDERSPTAAGYLRRDAEGRLGVEAVLQPPERVGDESVRAKQLLVIVDSSGSMRQEEKFVQARRAVLSIVDRLGPDDRYNVTEFDTDFEMFSATPVSPGETSREAIERWLGTIDVAGGTKLLPALEATLDQPDQPGLHRMAIVVTDGLLHDESEVLELLRAKLGQTRLFVVGTGRHVRQETLMRLAEFGRGAATFASDDGSLETAVTELYEGISRPLGWDVEVDWGEAAVASISPSRIPDLYADRPVRVLAWFDGELPTQLRLRMSTAEGERYFKVSLPRAPER